MLAKKPPNQKLLYSVYTLGAGGENRTLVSSLENLHTDRCTTPATVLIVPD